MTSTLTVEPKQYILKVSVLNSQRVKFNFRTTRVLFILRGLVLLIKKFIKNKVIKGLAGSGVQIVSISERTPDFETIRPKIKRWFELLTPSGPNWSTPINL